MMLGELENYSYPNFFCITYRIIKNNYPGEQVNILIRSLINNIQEKNWVIVTKKV